MSERLLRRGASTSAAWPWAHTLSAIGAESDTTVEQFVKIDEESQNEWSTRFGL